MNALCTDLYQLTMAAGYWKAGRAHEVATFELFFRRLPASRNFIVVAGIEQAIEYLLNLRFTADDIAYLKELPQFANSDEGFFKALAEFEFSGDVDAVPEGTPMFAGEPIVTLRAPIFQAQIPETYLLSMIGFQTLIATKARRMLEASSGRAVVEFGSRRAHSPEAGVLAARAAYIGGCTGTSNVQAGKRFGVPVFGTSSHSWVMSFPTEQEAFQRLQDLLGPATIHLIDSYDTIEGAFRVAASKEPFWGVRLDSGNLHELSRTVRQILDDGGHREAKILASGDLNEHKIQELIESEAPIDVFGVGTELATSADAPAHGAVYKLVEMDTNGETRYTAKYSEDKVTLPGAKQVFRFGQRDVIGLASESPYNGAPGLLRPVLRNGELVEPLPRAIASRAHSLIATAHLPKKIRSLEPCETPYSVELTDLLQQLSKEVQREVREYER